MKAYFWLEHSIDRNNPTDEELAVLTKPANYLSADELKSLISDPDLFTEIHTNMKRYVNRC